MEGMRILGERKNHLFMSGIYRKRKLIVKQAEKCLEFCNLKYDGSMINNIRWKI